MLRIGVEVGQVAAMFGELQRFPELLRPRLFVALRASLAEIARRAKDLVHVVTGHLRRSIGLAPIVPDGLGWRGAVEVTAPYAAVEELGIDRTVSVRAHERRVRSRDRVVIEKAPVRGAGGRFTGRVRSRRVVAEKGVAQVRAHSRHMRREAHPFLAPAEAASVSEIERVHVEAARLAWLDAGRRAADAPEGVA